ncbi:aromatic acid/H+ symport family MFS transporter [Pseudonocardia zijingensis]|jgi:AAHS family benzoate transporter-like MFS transporter|uniref:Aromatic acid/H+ symport family MFS transporter n=1 Tax=Pseudonocardia zijingensis TaxID=153376 RepID=A0ABN1Q5K6_9PSEU
MTTPSVQRRSTAAAVALGFAAIVFDGYDLIVYGSAVPKLLEHQAWNLTPTQAGAIGSYALVGAIIGAVLTGPLTDLLGRRRLFIASLAWFSVMMLLSAFAPTPWWLGSFRFLAGLGFGGIPPTAVALVIEVAPAARRHFVNALMLCGFPVGGVLAAVTALVFLEPLGFRALFAFGALPLVTLVPLSLWLLPESPNFVRRARGVPRTPRQSGLRTLLTRRMLLALTLFVLTNFCSFLLVFGLNTWLPQLMRGAGYQLGSALAFLLVLNLGAVVGGLAGSALADRWGSRWIATTLFIAAVFSLGLIAVPLPTPVVFVLVFVAGAATTGNQVVIYGYVATHYSAGQRATALGVSTGVGRLGAVTGPVLGGALVAAGAGLSTNVGVFALVALIGAVACAAVPRSGGAPADAATGSPVAAEGVAA